MYIFIGILTGQLMLRCLIAKPLLCIYISILGVCTFPIHFLLEELENLFSIQLFQLLIILFASFQMYQ